VAIACFDDTQRAALAQLLSAVPDWADLDAVDAALGAWTAARTRAECVAALRSAGVPAVPVLDARDRAADPHFSRRRVFIDGPTGRRTRGFPFVLRNYVPPVPASAPAVGQHNQRFTAQPHPS
jgi:crotonobetainyl-CoA:carnitine CoA-transferase CaiB-like acyl-CoA transferase